MAHTAGIENTAFDTIANLDDDHGVNDEPFHDRRVHFADIAPSLVSDPLDRQYLDELFRTHQRVLDAASRAPGNNNGPLHLPAFSLEGPSQVPLTSVLDTFNDVLGRNILNSSYRAQIMRLRGSDAVQTLEALQTVRAVTISQDQLLTYTLTSSG
jgi:hypothetical protein